MSRTQQYMQHLCLVVFSSLAFALCMGGRILEPQVQEKFALALNIAASIILMTLISTSARYRKFVWYIVGCGSATFAYMAWNVPQERVPWLAGSVFFLIFSVCIALHLVRFYGKAIQQFGLNGFGMAVLLFAALATTNVFYLILPWESAVSPPMTAPARTIYYLYRFFFSVNVAFAMLLAMRTRRASELMMLQGLTLLHTSAFGWSHVMAHADTDIRKWIWQVWSISMLLMIGGLIRTGSEHDSVRPTIAPWISVRFLLTAAIFFSNMGLLFGMRGMQVLAFEHGGRVGSVLVVCFASWAAADWMALYVSNRLDNVARSMPCVDTLIGEKGELALNPLDLVSSRLPLSELDAWVDSYNKIVERLNALSHELLQREREICLSALATQVSHDIRSPLAALQMLLPNVRFESRESEFLAKEAIRRIRTIADTLLERHRSGTNATPDSLAAEINLASLTRAAVAAKRVESGTAVVVRVDEDAEKVQAKFVLGDLERCLSNLLNNAIEASVTTKREVIAHLYLDGSRAVIDVIDHGKGIAPDTLTKLGSRGMTVGKSSGNGLGLFHARETMAQAGGELQLSSQLGKGTRVRLIVPIFTCIKKLSVPTARKFGERHKCVNGLS